MKAAAGKRSDAVTVVVPTHNRGDILGQTIQSILNQEGVAVEVIVVDDASTDATQDVLARFAGVRIVTHDKPTEQRKARNDGARLARTPWLAFCDDDDLWAPRKLRRQLDSAEAFGADWSTCSALFVDEHLTPVGGHRLGDSEVIYRCITRQNVVPGGGSGVLMRTALFEMAGEFREDAQYVEDWDLWVRLAQHGRVVACVDELLVAQRHWARSYSHRDLQGQYHAFLDMAHRYAGPGEKPRHTGEFEVRQRLGAESRIGILKDVPRILRRSPEDALKVAALLMLPDSALRRLYLRPLGTAAVAAAMEWLDPYRLELAGVAK